MHSGCPHSVPNSRIQTLCYSDIVMYILASNYCHVSQRGDSPFVYRDGIGWQASLPYIRKIRVSVAIGTQSGICLHKRVPMVKIWGSSKNDQIRITGELLKL